MERAHCDAKVKELMAETMQMFSEKYDKLMKSGAVDLEDYEDNYILPKLIMAALCKEAQWQWMPLHKKEDFRNEVENMYTCL